MPTISYRSGISIAFLTIYVPALLLAALLTHRHGSIFLFLTLFLLIRLLASSLQLATIASPTNPALPIAYTILQAIGLSPLELTALALLTRAIQGIERNRGAISIRPIHLRLVQLCVVIGLILGVVGGAKAGSGDHDGSARSLTRAAVGLFLGAFAVICVVTLKAVLGIESVQKGEKRVLGAVVASMPLLVVRLVYAGMAVFGTDERFSLLGGDVTVLLCMVMLMELGVVVVFEGVGVTLRVVEMEKGPEVEGSLLMRKIRGLYK
jgi:hypothetical protein